MIDAFLIDFNKIDGDQTMIDSFISHILNLIEKR
jgi:hypothetical protein